MASVSILLPTLNEEANIEKMITGIRSVSPDYELAVVDGLSTDRTVEIAKGLGARIILEKRRGKGFAVKRAFQEIDSDYLIMLDADQTYPVDAIPLFLEKLKEYDVVIGSRFKGVIKDGSMSGINYVGNMMISLFATAVYFRHISDVCTGMWGFTRKAYKSMDITAHTFELESNLFAQAAKKKLRSIELPIEYAKRGGNSKVQLVDGVKDCVFLLRERFRG